MKLIVIGAHQRRDDVEPLAIALPAGPLFLSAVEIAADQPLGDRDLLLRVAKIRGQLLDRATFVAIRYGFTAGNAIEAAVKCAAQIERWMRLLDEHREHVEMTLKVAATSAQPRPDRRGFTSGAEYLKALHAATHGVTIDDAFRAAVESRITPLTVEHRWIPRDEKSVEYVALIERSRIDDMRAAGEALKRECPHVAFLLSGPWPLEVFADADRE
ncbi:MAG TPA: GvpL/GvpF family gas vesicle protein [Thermoanaerobaculia bacterium]|nr:GvpL/GvpF family gas vesicle protein [Thermoanaerobaculia bacterium]